MRRVGTHNSETQKASRRTTQKQLLMQSQRQTQKGGVTHVIDTTQNTVRDDREHSRRERSRHAGARELRVANHRVRDSYVIIVVAISRDRCR